METRGAHKHPSGHGISVTADSGMEMRASIDGNEAQFLDTLLPSVRVDESCDNCTHNFNIVRHIVTNNNHQHIYQLENARNYYLR
jgi:hypothetical protein